MNPNMNRKGMSHLAYNRILCNRALVDFLHDDFKTESFSSVLAIQAKKRRGKATKNKQVMKRDAGKVDKKAK